MSASPRALSQMYASLGINLRKHNGTYRGWGWRDAVVVDLTAKERKILEKHGDLALDAHLRAKGQYPFPALTLRELKPLYLDTNLVENGAAKTVLCAGKGYKSLAKQLQKTVKRLSGVTLPIVVDSDFRIDDLAKHHCIMLGAAHENEAAATLTDQCFLNADATFPGHQGLLIRTVHNPSNKKHNILHICCGKQRNAEVLKQFLKGIKTENDCVSLCPIFFVDVDPKLRAEMHDKPKIIKYLFSLARHHKKPPSRLPARAANLVQRVAECYDSGGLKENRYNRGPLEVFNTAVRIYDATGDEDYLRLFAGLVWEMILYYTNTPGGASYIADMEFALCWFIPFWDAHEELSIFSDEQRLAITNFLLAASEMCAGYKAENWPTEPNEIRHNHETFPALTLYVAGRYFRDYYKVPAAREWIQIAKDAFSGVMNTRFKLREDSNLYQWLVPSHKVFFDRLVGKRRFITSGTLAKWAHNVELTTDNFGYPCDFGDTNSPISGGAAAAGLIEAAAGAYQNKHMQWVANHIRENISIQGPITLLASPAYLPGNRRILDAKQGKTPQLDKMPLDDAVRRQYEPEMKRSVVYDKIAFRENWSRNAQYLLLDGYSAGSHCHRDQNAIIRFNQLGRVWIVDNGYGKISGVTNSLLAFSGRQLGPEDHNTLIFTKKGGKTIVPPQFCSLKTFEDMGSVSIVQSALENYDRANWLRTIIWMKGLFFLTVDQVSLGKGLESIKCQWNMLGDMTVSDGMAVLEQKSVNGFLHWDPTVNAEASSYCNASWEAELIPEIYPYAELPIKKLNQIVPSPKKGSTPVFSTLFYASRRSQAAFSLQREDNGTFVVSGRKLRGISLQHKTKSFSIACANSKLTIQLPMSW